MLSHAEIYRRVCEARPECAVKRNGFVGHKLGWGTEIPFGPQWLDERGKYASLQAEQDALALITDHWTEMLPPERFVYRAYEEGNLVWICRSLYGSNHICYPTRFHALAEFYVPGSTKE